MTLREDRISLKKKLFSNSNFMHSMQK